MTSSERSVAAGHQEHSTVSHDRGASIGIAVIGLAWLLPALAAWPPLGAYPRAALLAAPPLAIAGVALLIDGRRRIAIALSGFAAAVHVLTYDPFYDPACHWTCLAAPVPLSSVVGLRTATLVVSGLALAATVAAIRQREPGRKLVRHGRGLLIACAGSALLTVAAISAPLADRATAARPLATLGALLAGAAVLAKAFHVRHVRGQVQRAVAQLAGTVTGPVIAVRFALPGGTMWLDGAGRPAPDGDGPAVVLFDGDRPAIRLLLGSRTNPALTLAAIGPASRLALHNARLRAAGEYQLAEIRASQRRIVE
ncbi:hypothetical protein ACFPIJ_50460, partial [Dactylosporangium cerinum]